MTATVEAPARCRHCKEPCFTGDAHPCCTFWAEHRPGEPCPACVASRGADRARARRTPRRKKGRS